MRTERWVETDRQAIGFTTGYGRGKTMPWFYIIYRVTEVRKVRGRVAEYRERTAYGKPLSARVASELSLGTLLAMVADGADTLSRYASAEDEKATSRRKRR